MGEMGRDEMDGRSPDGAAKRGLWRLMLKLPAVRGELQILNERSDALTSLCEAYEDASTMLGRLLHAPDGQQEMIEEYRTICIEIESDVIQYCLQRAGRVPK